MMSNVAKSFAILIISLNIPNNYLDSPTKLLSDLYLIKFFNASDCCSDVVQIDEGMDDPNEFCVGLTRYYFSEF